MAGRGRPAGFVMGAEHRAKIANSQIFKRLLQAAEGEITLTDQQERISLKLLSKVMPDVSSITIEGGETPLQVEHSAAPAKLMAYLDSIAERRGE